MVKGTWVDLAIARYAIRVYDVLEARGERVDGKQGGRRGGGGQTVVERVHSAPTLPLENETGWRGVVR